MPKLSAIQKAASLMGSKRSHAKAHAARLNGTKPKKKKRNPTLAIDPDSGLVSVSVD